jgi:hypothetical protein
MRMRICSLASSGSGAFLGAGVFWEVTVIKFTGTSLLGVRDFPPWSFCPDIRTSEAGLGVISVQKPKRGWGIDSGCGDLDS